MTDSKSLRESYLQFFESRAHLRLPSASLIPKDDPTLLLIGAGMAPFKPMFKGEVAPPSPRITTCQKCVRADDIDYVGRTSRHHTFFEMLGNFSFGDYFKVETCAWAWEYLLQVLKLPEERFWVTIHPEDDEAFAIWTKKIGVPASRVLRLADNFWGPIGLTGPCGPCSELIYDRGEEWGCGKADCQPGCDCDRYLELWNLVFTGLYKDEKGAYRDLPSKCIDTGLGLERLVMLMQNQSSPFTTDLFLPLLQAMELLCGKRLGVDPQDDVNLKIIADHSRALVFMAADGVFPSNEGRGYVFRRLLRRCVRLGKKLGMPDDFMVLLIKPIQETMGEIYPEIIEKDLYIHNLLFQEEKNFQRTLEQGMNLLDSLLAQHKGKGEKLVSGIEVFKLHDTYGFPMELTREIVAEQGIAIDEAGFKLEMQKQKARSEGKILEDKARAAYQVEEKTTFTGYETLSSTAEVLRLFKEDQEVACLNAGEEGVVILNLTPFYAASGGQVGDTGKLLAQDFEAQVLDTIKDPKEAVLHKVKVDKGELKVGGFVTAVVDASRRLAIARHHTATHLLHKALRETLGKHVTQAGSLVAPSYLRFDFTHFAALTKEQLYAVEDEVNQAILNNYEVHTQLLPLQEALSSGAMALFDEKYGDTVRLVNISNYSKELCGGTHLNFTAQAGGFKILSESAIGSGLRRIEAVCGFELLKHFRSQDAILHRLKQDLKVGSDEIYEALLKLKDKLVQSEKQIKNLEAKLAFYKAQELLGKAENLGKHKLIAAALPETPAENLRILGDWLKDKVGSGAILLGSSLDNKAVLMAMVTPDLIAKALKAGELVAQMAPLVGGKGGGKPDFAQAGGKEVAGLDAALAAGAKLVREKAREEK
jgi:alanyl-tRNA synthetase